MVSPIRRSGDGGATARRLLTFGAALVAAGVLSLVGCSPTVLSPYVSGPSPTDTSAPATSVTGPPATGEPSTTAAATSTPTEPSSPARAARLAPVRVTIPAIEVDAPLIRLGLTRSGALQVPTRAMTAGWYTGSPVPGSTGPAVIAGHVHWSGVPAVFARLAELRPGDRIGVARSDGSRALFVVDRVATYAKDRFPSELVYGSIDAPGLRLITCGGFDPVARAYEANVIVFATLSTS